MGMGTRQSQQKQDEIWIASMELARSPGHPFYQRLNELLEGEKFDEYVEGLAGSFMPTWDVPVWCPGVYFRSLLIGYFEGIEALRCWMLLFVDYIASQLFFARFTNSSMAPWIRLRESS